MLPHHHFERLFSDKSLASFVGREMVQIQPPEVNVGAGSGS